MAKANNTAIEQIIERLSTLNNKDMNAGLMTAIDIAKDCKKDERRQIENAYNSARNHPKNYHDAQHYFFMEYIDND